MPLASKTFADIITFTRASTGTYFDSAGVLQSAAINVPRFDYDPTTLLPRGILIEESRINALANSLLDGTVLSTQNVTVTAAARTLSFYGTGTITLSGAHAATVVGAGAYPTRTTLTFTPSAGTLTLTVTGTVQYANLETGLFATSFIPTTTATTRSADIANVNTLSPWFNSATGTLYAVVSTFDTNAGGFPRAFALSDGTASNTIVLSRNASLSRARMTASVGGVSQVASNTTNTWAVSSVVKTALAYETNNYAIVLSGDGVITDTLGAVPTITTMRIGGDTTATNTLNGHIKQLAYYSVRLTNTDLQAITV